MLSLAAISLPFSMPALDRSEPEDCGCILVAEAYFSNMTEGLPCSVVLGVSSTIPLKEGERICVCVWALLLLWSQRNKICWFCIKSKWVLISPKQPQPNVPTCISSSYLSRFALSAYTPKTLVTVHKHWHEEQAMRYLFILNWVAILSKHSATRDTCVTHLLEQDGDPSSTEACRRQRFTCEKRKTKYKQTLNRPEVNSTTL